MTGQAPVPNAQPAPSSEVAPSWLTRPSPGPATPPVEPPKVEKHRGFVAFFDVLGTREATDPEEFLKRWGILGKEARKQVEQYGKPGGIAFLFAGLVAMTAVAAVAGQSPESSTRAGEAFKELLRSWGRIRVFGDTVIITWDNDSRAGLFLLAGVLTTIFNKALGSGLFLRGAVSFGDYWENEESIVGPAVSDAANWHDEMDWIGIALTPTAGLQYDPGTDEKDTIVPRRSFVKHDVPFKSKTVPLYSINWPYHPDAPSREDLVKLFTARPIPFVAEAKYRHTIEFYDKVTEKR